MRIKVLITLLLLAAVATVAVPAHALCREITAVAAVDPVHPAATLTFEVTSDSCLSAIAARGGSAGRLAWRFTSTNQPEFARDCEWVGGGAPSCTGLIHIPGTVTVELTAQGTGMAGSLLINYI